MSASRYELTEPVAGFEEGDVLDVTARFGDWHLYDLKLESRASSRSRTVVVAESDAGFSEADILDETARFGDWHEYDLTFDPVSTDDDARNTTGRVTLTMDDFERAVRPVDASA
ncbi:hypothetical protein [Halorientalis salina]|uniref:hypothetical protein n=1 Tax=Halorientalis salina TaxID=2932266 RepID=UPI0010AB50BA|nr:hypothetical protein [Halorientalis salina]